MDAPSCSRGLETGNDRTATTVTFTGRVPASSAYARSTKFTPFPLAMHALGALQLSWFSVNWSPDHTRIASGVAKPLTSVHRAA
jgi:hypothetical protein